MEIHVKEKVLHVHVTYGMRHENINHSLCWLKRDHVLFLFFMNLCIPFVSKWMGKTLFYLSCLQVYTFSILKKKTFTHLSLISHFTLKFWTPLWVLKKKKITEFSKVECFFTQRSMLEKIFTIFFSNLSRFEVTSYYK